MADFCQNPAQLIPQKAPFLFIKKITAYDPERQCLTATTSFTNGDLPVNSNGQITQAALIEALAQSAAAMVGQKNSPDTPPAIGYLAAVSNFVYHKPALADEELTLTVQATRELGAFLIVAGQCSAGEEVLASGELTFFLDN